MINFGLGITKKYFLKKYQFFDILKGVGHLNQGESLAIRAGHL